MTDMKMTDHQNCEAWNCRTWNWRTRLQSMKLQDMNFMSCIFMPCNFVRPSISCPAISCPAFSVNPSVLHNGPNSSTVQPILYKFNTFGRQDNRKWKFLSSISLVACWCWIFSVYPERAVAIRFIVVWVHSRCILLTLRVIIRFRCVGVIFSSPKSAYRIAYF